LECLRMIDDLIQTRLMVSLCMLLLICGINCYVESDRNSMRRRFALIQEDYKFGNFAKMVQIVEESWRRNPKGRNVVDWASLANEHGWCLYLG
jgi:transcriptional activator protein UGA3